MHRITRVAAVSLTIAALAIASAASAAEPVSDCVVLREAQTGDGMSFDVDNRCPRRLACKITWTVSCQNPAGKTTRSTQDVARFVVDASASHRAAASAKSCGDSWKIDDVQWSCDPTP